MSICNMSGKKISHDELSIEEAFELVIRLYQELKKELEAEKTIVNYYAFHGYSVACKRIKERSNDN